MESLPMMRQIACAYGALGIAAAAYGAHGLEKIASAEQVRWWGIATALVLVTVPALLLVSVQSERFRSWVGPLFVSGISIFSGSLYLMALGGPRVLGAITPLGGLCLLVAWCGAALKKSED